MIENVPSDVRINGTQRVVQDVEISLGVHRASQTHSLLLASAQIDALIRYNERSNKVLYASLEREREISRKAAHLFSDFRLVTGRKHLEVRTKSARGHNIRVEHFVFARAEQNVVFECGISNPRLLRNIRHRSLCNQLYGTAFGEIQNE